MARVALIACGTALAALAACTTYDPHYTPNAPNPDPTPLATSATGTILLPAGTVVAAPTAPAVVAAPVVVRSTGRSGRCCGLSANRCGRTRDVDVPGRKWNRDRREPGASDPGIRFHWQLGGQRGYAQRVSADHAHG
jgi:hypothetical protein